MKIDTKKRAARLAAARAIIAKNKDAKEILTKAFTNKPPAKSAAKAPAVKTFTRAQIAKMTQEQYRAQRSQILQAMAAGRVK
jgi:hypothetical protein